MSSNPLLPQYRCVTPPPLPKHKFAALAHPAYTSLISSPVTPLSSPHPHVVDLLHEDERYALNALLSRASVHRHAEKTLLDRTRACGNQDYIKNRTVIIEWMCEVSVNFKFLPVTLHLAVRHMDWTFACRTLPQRFYQLVATAALFIAAKCEEAGHSVPTLEDFRYICDNVFETKLIRSMELYMLQLLKWDVTAKTPIHFLNHYMWIVRRRIEQTGSASYRDDAKQAFPFQTTDEDNIDFDIDPSDFMSDDDDDDDVSGFLGNEECNCVGECTCEDFAMSETSDAVEDIAELPSPVNRNSNRERTRTVGMSDWRRTNAAEKEGDALFRFATCVLEIALYDVYVRGKFPPHVLAATALSIASELCKDTCLRPADVAGVTDVSELGMLDCRMVLWKLFKQAQE